MNAIAFICYFPLCIVKADVTVAIVGVMEIMGWQISFVNFPLQFWIHSVHAAVVIDDA